MPLAFYNTLTRTVEPFQPLRDGAVTMYACGPTVYDYFHIGNARSFIMADVLRRYLEYRGYAVTFVMNITDIDDRIIAKALAEGVEASEVAGRYADAFLEDIGRCGVRPATVHPRATQCIPDIVRHIAALVERGAAYEADGDVYFSVEAFPGYGKLSGKRLEDLIAGERVEVDARKRHPADFALWKAAKPGEPWWESPWGKGRPGWHIECSVMSQKHLGSTFDIHAGGNDLIFPHHENEIAQSEALTRQPLARTWIHFGFLNINATKMSKSLGNFLVTREVLKRYPAEALRFFYLQTHYRSPLNLTLPDTEELPAGTLPDLESAQRGLQRLQTLRAALDRCPDGPASFDVASYRARFEEAMDRDLNTPEALGAVFDFVRDANAALASGDGLRGEAKEAARTFLDETAGGVFGLLRRPAAAAAADEDVERLLEVIIALRARARADKQYALADFVRDTLKGAGFTLEDGKAGTTWKRVPSAPCAAAAAVTAGGAESESADAGAAAAGTTREDA